MKTIFLKDLNINGLVIKNRAIATIGFFDGVHLGHQFLINRLAEMAKHFHCSVVAVFYALRSMGITRKKDHNVYGAGACIKWKTTCNGCDVLVIIRLFMLMKQVVVPICTGNMAGQKKRSRKGLYKRKEISA